MDHLKRIISIGFLLVVVSSVSALDIPWEELGWQVAPEARWTTLDKKDVLALGGQAGVNWRQWFFGVGGYGTVTDVVWDYYVTEGKYDGYVFYLPRSLWWCGGIVDVSFFSGNPLQPFLGLLIGPGFSELANSHDRLFIIEPRLGTDIVFFDHLRFGFITTYRVSLVSDWFPTDWVSGLNAGIQLKIGSWR